MFWQCLVQAQTRRFHGGSDEADAFHGEAATAFVGHGHLATTVDATVGAQANLQALDASESDVEVEIGEVDHFATTGTTDGSLTTVSMRNVSSAWGDGLVQ